MVWTDQPSSQEKLFSECNREIVSYGLGDWQYGVRLSTLIKMNWEVFQESMSYEYKKEEV